MRDRPEGTRQKAQGKTSKLPTVRTTFAFCLLGSAFRPTFVTGLLGTLVVACAARGPSPQLVAEMGKAETLLREGCYQCLQEALAIYERLAAAPRAPHDARRGAFEAALLLTVRAKELGMPYDTHVARARTLAQNIPPAVPPALPPSVYLDAADYFIGEISGFDPEARQQRTRRPRPLADAATPPSVRAALAPAATELVADYLALAIDCEDARARLEIQAEDMLRRHGRAPLIRYRLAICAVAPAELVPLREGDPRWTDTLFVEGRRQMSARPVADVVKAAELFTAAHVAFPDSLAITLALAGAQNALSEYPAALASYDLVLSSEPTHRDALLGRVMSLSYLNRHPEAVASATRMIELGTWLVGDAYYWRAWNRYHLHLLDLAWSDVEQATKLLINTSVYTLAGFIAWARTELDTAIDRFDRAFAMDSTNCEAVWSAGLVHVDQQGWTMAAPKFSRAMSCFIAAAAQARAEMAETRKAPWAETIKTRRIAAAQKRLDTAEHRTAQAAFNAAHSFLRLNEKGLALNHVDVAAEHPLLKEKATALRVTIEKLPQ